MGIFHGLLPAASPKSRRAQDQINGNNVDPSITRSSWRRGTESLLTVQPKQLDWIHQPPINQPLHQLTNHYINQLVNQSTNQLINQLVNQSTNQFINQLVNQLTNQWTNLCTVEPTKTDVPPDMFLSVGSCSTKNCPGYC